MTHRCPLCGYGFEPDEMVEGGCRTCPIKGSGCGLVRCPACGYEWPDERRSRLVGLLGRLFGGKGGRS